MTETVDAWIVGQHDVPPDAPRNVVGSAVVIRDRDTGEWTGMSLDQFEREFEWLSEDSATTISVGDLGVF